MVLFSTEKLVWTIPTVGQFLFPLFGHPSGECRTRKYFVYMLWFLPPVFKIHFHIRSQITDIPLISIFFPSPSFSFQPYNFPHFFPLPTPYPYFLFRFLSPKSYISSPQITPFRGSIFHVGWCRTSPSWNRLRHFGMRLLVFVSFTWSRPFCFCLPFSFIVYARCQFLNPSHYSFATYFRFARFGRQRFRWRLRK